ncbi:MAG: TssN family type VI secretion system protein [Tannerellaceae bacterium]|nr:TssN family type VI secretion system protein [Tannerellaceae bacterium]
MPNNVSSFLVSYLLMPILAFIMAIVAYFYMKKNKLISNRKFIFFMLLGGLLLALPALFGFIHYWFMPYVYLGLQLFYLVVGYYNIKIIRSFLQEASVEKKDSFTVLVSVQFLMLFIGFAFFSLIFNLCNELKYGMWAATCLFPFMLPLFVWETYNKYMAIPDEVFKSWKYTDSYDLSSFEVLDYDKLRVMELEIFKTVEDAIPTRIKAKAPDNMPFGVWFYKFLTDYNLKFPQKPIVLENDGLPYEWIFYVKRSFFVPRKYIDHELSVTANQIKEKYTILAKRVNEINPE